MNFQWYKIVCLLIFEMYDKENITDIVGLLIMLLWTTVFMNISIDIVY